MNCALCGEPIVEGERTDEGNYGTVHHNCPDFIEDDGTDGQDRESYSDDQDRENYSGD